MMMQTPLHSEWLVTVAGIVVRPAEMAQLNCGAAHASGRAAPGFSWSIQVAAAMLKLIMVLMKARSFWQLPDQTSTEAPLRRTADGRYPYIPIFQICVVVHVVVYEY